MTSSKTKTECDRCGTCCRNGGPALHQEDRHLLLDERLLPEHLVTIRKGEPVFSPAAEKPEPVQFEIIKIKGRGNEWTCLFFSAENTSCTVYAHRPLECSLLKCWDTADIEQAAGRNLLSRYDIIAFHEPVLPLIKTHEKDCPLDNLAPLLSEAYRKKSRQRAVSELQSLVNADLAIRAQAYAKLRFSLDLELFFFGRPLFTILQQYGMEINEKNGMYRLSTGSFLSGANPAKP